MRLEKDFVLLCVLDSPRWRLQGVGQLQSDRLLTPGPLVPVSAERGPWLPPAPAELTDSLGQEAEQPQEPGRAGLWPWRAQAGAGGACPHGVGEFSLRLPLLIPLGSTPCLSSAILPQAGCHLSKQKWGGEWFCDVFCPKSGHRTGRSPWLGGGVCGALCSAWFLMHPGRRGRQTRPAEWDRVAVSWCSGPRVPRAQCQASLLL